MRNEDENVKHVSELFSFFPYFWPVSVCVICLGAKVKRIGNMATGERKTNKQKLSKKVEMFFGEQVGKFHVGLRSFSWENFNPKVLRILKVFLGF